MLFSIMACTSTQHLSGTESKQLNNILEGTDHFKGLAVWDMKTNKYIFKKNADKLFTPASNVKILSLFSAIHLIGDSLPLFEYYKESNKLHIRGNGNPAFLHPRFEYLNEGWIEKLQISEIDTVIIHQREMKNKRFGPGWAWDDYPYYFQTEISSFPLFGNALWAEWDKSRRMIHLFPDYMARFADVKTGQNLKGVQIKREESANSFIIKLGAVPEQDKIYSAPFLIDPYTLTQLISDTFELPVLYDYEELEAEWQAFHPIPTDTLYRRMMKESDNFIAEHLLLAASGLYSDTLSSDLTIQKVQSTYFPGLQNEIKWVDGSGLSRYNLMSPASLIQVLRKLHKNIAENKLRDYFMLMGHDENEKKNFEALESKGIFAKTGSLKNHYAISGFMDTESDHPILFCFMHDNFLGSHEKLKPEIIKMLTHLKKSL